MLMRIFIGLIYSGLGFGLEYPSARREMGVGEVLNGIRVMDPYRWLENQTSPEVVKYWKDQNLVTDSYLANFPGSSILRESLKQLGSVDPPKSVKKYGDFGYFLERPKDKGNSVLYRESASLGLEVVVDPNPLSPKDTAFVKFFSVSPNNRTLVYGISRKGSDWTRLHVVENSPAMKVGEVLEWIRDRSITWAKDKESFFYTAEVPPVSVGIEDAGQEAEPSYFSKLKLHRIGTPQSSDETIWKDEPHNHWYASAKYSTQEEFLFLNIYRSTAKNSKLLISDSNSNSNFTTLIDDFDGATEYLGKFQSKHLFTTSRNSRFGSIVQTALPDFSPTEFIPEVEGYGLLDAKLGNQTILVDYIKNATHHLKVFDRNGRNTHSFPLPMGRLTFFEFDKNETEILFNLTDIFFKRSYTINLNTSSLTQTSVSPPPPGLNPDLFEVSIQTYIARDGTPVPITLVHSKNLVLDKSHPTFLYAYGGFNDITFPSPQPYLLAMLQSMGMVLAFAHIRGGGENGLPWYHSGANLNKQASYSDFQDAAIYLVNSNYTQHKLIAINGRSNGGTLAAVSYNQAPTLFGSVVADVGVMDLTRFQLFHDGVGWFDDFGNARENRTELQNTLKFSPYHNILCQSPYPPILVTSGSHDDRVSTLHSLKFAAKLQACHPPSPALLKVTEFAGHGCGGCGKPIPMDLEEKVDMLSFISITLGISPKPLTS